MRAARPVLIAAAIFAVVYIALDFNKLFALRYGADTGNLTLRWRAEDKNLSPQPISIYFADKPEGPWRPVPGGAAA